MNALADTQRLLTWSNQVDTSCMEPVFTDESYIRINTQAYAWTLPRRGDIIALRSPSAQDCWEIKRIVGLPGELLSWKGSHIWINGLHLNEPYLPTSGVVQNDQVGMLELGHGEYFVMGDNRLRSNDSRHYGPIWFQDILGQAV